MKDVLEDRLIEAARFRELAGTGSRVLEGHRLSEEEGLAILRSGDEEILDVLAAAYRVRYRWHGNRVHLNFLMNAKSGRCAEDCAYCSQSGTASSEIPRYGMLDTDELFAGAQEAAERQAATYCIVTARRGPTEPELDRIARSSPGSRRHSACISARRWDLLTPEQAEPG